MRSADRKQQVSDVPIPNRSSSLRRQRLKWTWVLAPMFFLIADPEPGILVLGALVSVVGLLLRAVAAGSILKDQVLSTGGVYSFLRHPLYVGSFLIGTGFVVASGRWWLAPVFLFGFLMLYSEVVRREEAHLQDTFGAPYVRYRDRVPAVAPIFGRRFGARGQTRFRLSTYFRNAEWEAFLGVLLGFGILWAKMTLLG